MMRAFSAFLILTVLCVTPAGGQVPGEKETPPTITPGNPPITVRPGGRVVSPAPAMAPASACGAPTYGDTDGDGHVSVACDGAPDGRGGSLHGDDCDDRDPNRYPGNTEVSDPSHDEDCDLTTFGSLDRDKDGYLDSNSCNVQGSQRYCGDDCDDTENEVHPGAPDHCDGRDNDCDGTADRGVQATLYHDQDQDGFGDPGQPVLACFQDLLPGRAANNYDCDDTDPTINPITGTCP